MRADSNGGKKLVMGQDDLCPRCGQSRIYELNGQFDCENDCGVPPEPVGVSPIQSFLDATGLKRG